jgi:acetylornithine deacetylase/succinyl-diaminopimelate desuccinylase-like protein
MPRPDNAIYELIAAVAKVQAYRFPVHLNPVTEAFFAKQAKVVSPSLGIAMSAIAINSKDRLAETVLSRDPSLNSTLRTTCVATLMEAGHAENALPQHAKANINCRIVPGETIEETRLKLSDIVDDPGVTVTAQTQRGPVGKPAPLDPAVFGPAENLAAEMFPGLPIIPVMSTGATDSIYLSSVGIPSYGAPGILGEFDGGGIHGLNEHIRVSSVLKGRAYLYRLIKAYADVS